MRKKSKVNVLTMAIVVTIAFTSVMTIIDLMNNTFDIWETIIGAIVFFVVYLAVTKLLLRYRNQ